MRTSHLHNKKWLIGSILVILGLVATITYGPSPAEAAPIETVIAASTPQFSTEEIIEIESVKYGVPEETLHDVLNCESRLDPSAVGDNGESFGIAQIHLVDHPDVTVEEALDQNFAIEFLAKKISEGRGELWTCYRILYGS